MEYETKGFGYLIKRLDKYSRLCVPMSDLVNTIKKAKEFGQPKIVYGDINLENFASEWPKSVKNNELLDRITEQSLKVSQKTLDLVIDI